MPEPILIGSKDWNVNRLEALRDGVNPGDGSAADFFRQAIAFLKNASLEFRTSGTAGKAKEISLSVETLRTSARRTIDYFGLLPGSRFLLCLPPQYIAGTMMIVRAAENRGELTFIPPFSDGLRPDLFRPGEFDLVSLVPSQLRKNPEIGKWARNLLLGGAPLGDLDVSGLIRAGVRVTETYGMTETASHVALRDLSRGESDFRPLPGFRVSLGEGDRLIIHGEGLPDGGLITQDKARLDPDGGFAITGRLDTLINTGGLKVDPAELEKDLRGGLSGEFCVTSVPDRVLGEALVVFFAGTPDTAEGNVPALRKIKNRHPEWKFSLFYGYGKSLPLTDSGKIIRRLDRFPGIEKI